MQHFQYFCFGKQCKAKNTEQTNNKNKQKHLDIFCPNTYNCLSFKESSICAIAYMPLMKDPWNSQHGAVSTLPYFYKTDEVSMY